MSASSDQASTWSAEKTLASPPVALTSVFSHSKSSRAPGVSGSAYTACLIGIAPSCWSRRQVRTRRFEGCDGSWWTKSSQRRAVWWSGWCPVGVWAYGHRRCGCRKVLDAVTFVSEYMTDVTTVNEDVYAQWCSCGGVLLGVVLAAAQQPANPRQQPGAAITMFAPEQHDLYDGHYLISANRIHMVGGLNDPAGWDHMDNEARTVKPVPGTAEIDINDLTNTGTFEARLKIPEGDLVLAVDKFPRVQSMPERRHRWISARARTDQGAATTTGRRRSSTSPAGDTGTRR